jgi:lauroyl/myristoyl acyltransferase
MPGYSRFASSLRYSHRHSREYAKFAAALRAVLAMTDEALTETLFRSHVDMQHRRRMMFTVDALMRRKNPRIEFAGAEELSAALDRGRGAIVWASQFMFQTLAGKRALWERGFKPIQVSSVHHGFSRTPFGDAVINRMLRRAENRYLKERIIFDHDGAAAVTRKIVEALDRGELVLLTNNTHSGSVFVEMRFGDNGYISMPVAPLSIATRRGTPIFSMAILETAPFSNLRVTVAPIDAGDGTIAGSPTDKRDYVRMARLALTARDQLFEQYRLAPDQFVVSYGLTKSVLDPC